MGDATFCDDDDAEGSEGAAEAVGECCTLRGMMQKKITRERIEETNSERTFYFLTRIQPNSSNSLILLNNIGKLIYKPVNK